MNASFVRLILRWSHITVVLFLGAYFYSPLPELSWSKPLIQYAIIPYALLSGVAMWKQAWVMKLFKKG